MGAVFGVETARNLDLAHLLTGRQINAEDAFYSGLLVFRRAQQVDPHRRVQGGEVFTRKDEAACLLA